MSHSDIIPGAVGSAQAWSWVNTVWEHQTWVWDPITHHVKSSLYADLLGKRAAVTSEQDPLSKIHCLSTEHVFNLWVWHCWNACSAVSLLSLRAKAGRDVTAAGALLHLSTSLVLSTRTKYQKWGRLLCPDEMVSGSVTEESEETSQYRLWDRKSL